MEYSWPSSVNVSNFVTVRPGLGDARRSMSFDMWKEQMVCLVESQDVAGFINGEIEEPQTDEQKLWRRTDRLVKGWILGSIKTDVLQKVCKLRTAREVWLELEKIFNPISETPPQQSAYTSRIFTQYLPLYNAAITGDWETANTLFFRNNISETEALITMDQQTALHIAVQSGRANDFVRNLVRIMRPESLFLRDQKGYTALHNSALVGNTEAARAMLEKNLSLLYVLDNKNRSPVRAAASCHHKSTLIYLLSVYESNTEHFPLEGLPVIDFFIEIIASEFIGVALDLVDKYPYLARSRGSINSCALKVIADMGRIFQCRESFRWWEKLIYHCVPIEHHLSRSTFVSGDIDISVWKRLKTMIWKVMEHLVPRMKVIKDKKELRKQALELAEKVCQEMQFLPEHDAWAWLRESLFKAAETGNSEIVEMIIEMYPCTIDTRNNTQKRDIMHVAVSNRFENIFNLIYSMSDRKNIFSNSLDFKRNNLMHMCARLAPPHRLNIVPGAALQMQRELQWFNVPEYPTKLFFFCEVEPAIGGETPVVLSHVVYERMKDKCPDFVDKLEKHGVIYTRVLGEEDDPLSPIGRGWKSTFLTTHKSVAEERAAKLNMKLEWTNDGVKSIMGPIPAIKYDESRQRKIWLNSMVAAYTGWDDKRNDPKKAVTFGDGSPLPEHIIHDCLKILEEESIAIPWKKGDVLLIDNLAVLHSRKPFTPPRRILASQCK